MILLNEKKIKMCIIHFYKTIKNKSYLYISMFVDDFMSMEKIWYTHKVDNTVIAGRVLRVEE